MTLTILKFIFIMLKFFVFTDLINIFIFIWNECYVLQDYETKLTKHDNFDIIPTRNMPIYGILWSTQGRKWANRTVLNVQSWDIYAMMMHQMTSVIKN